VHAGEPAVQLDCGNLKEPMTATERLQLTDTAQLVEQTLGLNTRFVRAVVQVFVHVMIGTNGTGNVSDARIDDNIQLLNDALNASANIEFRRIGTVRRHQNNSWFQSRVNCTDPLYTRMKEILWRGEGGCAWPGEEVAK